MSTGFTTASAGKLRARELREDDGAVLRRFFRGIACIQSAPATVTEALTEPGRGRLMAVEDEAGPLVLMPFDVAADAAAQIGAPLFHPRAGRRRAAALRAASGAIERLGASVLLATVTPGAPHEGDLRGAGFERSARLLDVRRVVSTAGEGARVAAGRPGYRWRSYDTGEREAFAEVFNRTLEGSLDVPELPVCREGALAMRAFEERGEWAGEDFALLEAAEGPSAGGAAGIVLCVARGGSFELAYFGVVPEMRGGGLGRLLVLRALERARERGATAVTAFVDSRNTPALLLYEEQGFSEKRAVIVYIKRCKNF